MTAVGRGSGTESTVGRLSGQKNTVRVWRLGGTGLLLAVAVAFPLVFTNPAVSNYGVLTLVFVAAAVSWNIFSGYTGYISLGHAIFFGTGAYFTGVATKDWHVTGSDVFGLLPLAGVAAAIIAVPLGIVALRVRRHTFVVITIAFFFIFQLMAYNLSSLTGGTSGLLTPTINFDPSTFNNPFYYVALAVVVCVITLSWLIRRSRFGLQLRAIKDDEDRARGLGVRPMRVKLSAFVISAVPMALLGGLWWYYIGIVDPSSGFDPLFDVAVALMAFLGGLGTVSGPILGALILEPTQLYFTQQVTSSYVYLILYGVLFLVVILVLPRGIIPTGAELITGWRERRAKPAGPPAPGEPPRGAVGRGSGRKGSVTRELA